MSEAAFQPEKSFQAATWTGEVDRTGTAVAGTWHLALRNEGLDGKFTADTEN
jgi:hypothetical protein